MSVTAYVNSWDLSASAAGVQSAWSSLGINIWGFRKVTVCVSLSKLDASGDTKATAYIASASTYRDLGGGIAQTQFIDLAADATSKIVLDYPSNVTVFLEVQSRTGTSRVNARAVCFVANTDPDSSY